MEVCRVVGQAVSTVKEPGLRACKLLIVTPCGPNGEATGDLFVATDTVGAGEHELVLVVRGSAARATQRTQDAPTDASIVGILDSLSVDGESSYRKNP
jgi:ethanolamine utilization protein EutN